MLLIFSITILFILPPNKEMPQSFPCGFDLRSKPRFVVLKCLMNTEFGRSGEAQTRGLRIPNAARYQLRYTPIVYLIVVV